MIDFNVNGFNPCCCDVTNLDEWAECHCCTMCGNATGEHNGKLCLACLTAMLECYVITTHRRLCVAKRQLEVLRAHNRKRSEI